MPMAVRGAVPAKARPKPAATAKAKPAKRPRAAKADGHAPVAAFIASLPGWQSTLGKRIDAIIVREAPGVKKAIKWNSAMYGLPGRGWFASMGGFSKYVKVNFFAGARLRPTPPGGSGKTMRYVDIPSLEALDEKQMASWVRQAAAIPGWASGPA